VVAYKATAFACFGIGAKLKSTGGSLQLAGHIVIVDDDLEMQVLLKELLLPQGHTIMTYSSAFEAQQQLTAGVKADLIISDINMPGIDGMNFIRNLRELDIDIPVIIMTAFGSIESAVNAMKEGAVDYLQKPFSPESLRQLVHRVLTQKQHVQYVPPSVEYSQGVGEMIGRSEAMQKVFNMIRRVSKSTAHVLIMGESGTGKEMVARAIHNEGPRSHKPFVALNCAAIPENLLESELFGHAKGSFTGAHVQKRGLMEEANGGTFFLDEIGDMPLALQAKLLRVLQERKIKPVGQNTFKDIDVRILAATHKNLNQLIARGLFREDLYYRLSVIPITLPALRERPDDIPLFAEFFLKRFVELNHSEVKGFTKEAIAKLKTMPWEGNVRQLENTIERAIILCDEPFIDVPHICHVEPQTLPFVHENEDDHLQSLSIREMEKRCLEAALEKAHGRKQKAAKLLGISRKTLYRKEKAYGISF
jgi:DNA-binding NtrC family response regulator